MIVATSTFQGISAKAGGAEIYWGNIAIPLQCATLCALRTTLLEISERPKLLFELGIERRGRGGGYRAGIEGGQILEEGA